MTKLSTQLLEANKERKRLEHTVSERGLELTLLRQKYESVNEQNENKMDKSDHDIKIERLHKYLLNIT